MPTQTQQKMKTRSSSSSSTVQNASSSSNNSSSRNMMRMVQNGSVVIVVATIFFNAGVSSVSGWTLTAATPKRTTTVPRRSSLSNSNTFGFPRQQQQAIRQAKSRSSSSSSPLVLLSSSSSSSSSSDGSISTIDLSSGGTKDETLEHHERVGQQLAESIQRWLDSEWFPQDIHLQMGLSAKQSYVECRTSDPPQHDVMDILMKISLDLSDDWEEKYDAEAFINPYDVGNYAADWLTKTLTDVEGCECTSELF